MDLASLAVVLRAALSPDPGERKAAEESLEQLQYTPQHLVSLLRIIVDSEFDMGVRQAASIHFKNFVSRNWSPDDPGQLQKISFSDKDTVRENILAYMTQVPTLLRSQLGECLKSIILADYPDQWPGLLLWIQSNLQQDQQIYGALYVLRILSRKYEFRSDEERVPIYQIVGETFPQLLSIYGKLVQITNPALEVSNLIKLICKIFWSSIYLEIPKQLFEINVFNAWMTLLLNMLERPVPLGQPTDPDLRNSWGWWKVKKWIIQILNRLYTRFSDMQIQKPENKAFAQMFHKNYACKILECYLTLLNAIRVGGYLPDRVTNLILQYLSCSISKNSMYDLLAPHLDIILFEIIFPLICFNNNDQMLWDEDPHEYVRKGYDVIEDLYSPRTAAMDFVNEFVRKRGKENLQKVVQFIVVIFNRYVEEPIDVKSYHQKDGALLAVGALCDKLKQTDPYKSELESMLVQHVFPEFKSHVGHLRAKAAWVSGQYAGIAFSDPKNFQTALHYVISGLHDSELPVRVDSLFALRPFIEACQDLNEIRPYVPQLLDELFKLMKEVENEDLVVTLEAIVDRFGEEMAPYAIGLCQNLAAAFWRCMGSSEAEDDDSGALAAVGCLRAIGAILGSVNRLPRLFIEIEPIVLPIMKKMLTTDGQDVFEEVLEIISYMTFYSPTISLEMWSLWPLLMEALDNWALDYFENILIPLDNYISRGTAHFLSCKDPDYQLSLWNMISSIMSDKNMEDSDIKPAPKLIEVVLQNCKGQVDNWIEPYLRITISRLQRAEKAYLKCLLIEVIANALYYNASLTLSIMQKLGVATAVFVLWFRMLQEVKKSGACTNFRREHDKKVCCMGLTSLLLLPSVQLPDQALDRVFRATLVLLVSYKDQIAEASMEDDNSYHDMDGLRSDSDKNNEDEDDMGVDAEDGDEASSLKLQKLASKARAFYPDHDDESDDDYSDDEEFQSPIGEVDPFVFFVDAMKVIQASDPARFQTLMRSLDPQSQSLTNNIVQHAEMRRAELEKDKQEKATSL